MTKKKAHKITKRTTRTKRRRVVKAKRNKTEKIKLLSDFTKIRKTNEYLEFINFIALPRVMRHEVVGVDTQEEFCERFKVDKGTLSNWKKIPGFWEDITEIRRALFRERSADVILSLEAKCLNPDSVTGSDVRVYLTAIGEYREKHEIENELSPKLQEALERIDQMIP